jgi:predicted nucleic-acid-binding Zn-ribbon protein
MKFKSNEMGRCPFCNSQYFEYGAIEFESDLCYFPWKCMKCGHTGEEWYSMEFVGHNVNTEDGNVEITYDMIGDDE